MVVDESEVEVEVEVSVRKLGQHPAKENLS